MRKIRQQARAGTQQVDSACKPISLRCGPFRVPKAGSFQFGLNRRKQFVDRKLLQILLVEPFELGAVEYSIGPADTAQGEALN